MKVEIILPDKLFLSGNYSMAVIPGSEGYFGAMDGHCQFTSTLTSGIITLYKSNVPGPKYFVDGGFVQIANDRCVILAHNIAELVNTDLDKFRKQREDMQSKLNSVSSDEEEHQLLAEVTKLDIKIDTLEDMENN